LINSLRVSFLLNLCSWVGGWIGGRRFVLQWCKGFASHRIHMLPFSTCRFANRAPEMMVSPSLALGFGG
jgi:hypothetical protein